MKIQSLLIAVILAVSVPAWAQSSTGVKAYEVYLSEVRLPRGDTGTLGFRECEDCDYKTVRVSAATEWRLDGRNVTLEEFKRAMERVVKRDAEAVAIMHDLNSDRIKLVSVYL